MHLAKPLYVELHGTYGLRVILNRHERLRKVRKDDKGYYVVCWKWSKMRVYIDPIYLPEAGK